jgi:hypothetical protein
MLCCCHPLPRQSVALGSLSVKHPNLIHPSSVLDELANGAAALPSDAVDQDFSVPAAGGIATYALDRLGPQADADLQPYPTDIALSSLDGSNGFKIDGISANDLAGRSVASAGDVNGDGFDDVIVGVGNAEQNHTGDNVASYVVYGAPAGFAAEVPAGGLNGTSGFVINGSGTVGNKTGFSVASAGDINGDGLSDVIVGAYGTGSGAGASYVIFGATTVPSGQIVLSVLNGTTGFKLSGVAGDQSGFSVASAGDVNHDGFADLVIGAPGASPHGAQSGAAYVVFGHASGFGANVDLSTLNGTTGFKISGAAAGDRAGTSVASAGDVNGDGFSDVLIGAQGANSNGSAYVVFGQASGFTANFDLSTLTGSNGFRLDGVGAGDHAGISVASAGDVNADGFADIIVGANLADSSGTDSGAAYVVFGAASGFAATIDLSTLNGTNGFKLTGATGDQSGFSVASAGDVNGDGYADLIIGAPAHGSLAGESYVVFGAASGFAASIDLTTLNGTTGFALDGVTAGDNSGMSVASAGDVNGDGFSDLVVGATGVDPLHGTDFGAAYVIFGRLPDAAVNRVGNGASQTLAGGDFNDTFQGNGGNDALYGNGGVDVALYSGAISDYSIVHNATGGYTITDLRGGSPDGTDILRGIETAQFTDGSRTLADLLPYPSHVGLSVLDGSNGFKIYGGASQDQVGYALSSAGDLNHDGYADIVVGSHENTDYVIFGQGTDFTPSIYVPDLNGTNGFELTGLRIGDGVSSAGDVNGDGIDDLLVTAEEVPNGQFLSAFVLFGKAGGFAPSYDLATLSNADGFRLAIPTVDDRSSVPMAAAAADVNGDGYSDLIFSNPADSAHGTETGAVYVVFGHGGAFATTDVSTLNGTDGFKIIGENANDFAGSALGAGDVNGDGFGDIIIGANAIGTNRSGDAYVVFGQASGFAASIDLSTLNGSNGFKLTGVAAYDLTGESIGSAGDINGDGFADLIISARGSDFFAGVKGAAYVVFGQASGFAASIDLGTLNGTNGFKLVGAADYDGFGTSVASAGDVNGDGFSDIIVGSPSFAGSGGTAGASYVVFGSASGFSATLDVSTLNGANGFRIDGVGAGDNAGYTVSSAGDVNDDGFSDLLIGAIAPNEHTGGFSYVMYGRLPDSAVTRTGTNASQTLAGGDFNDTLSGLGGNDDLYGNRGNDTLTGGAGADTYHFAQSGADNVDTITDYSYAGGDVIDLSHLLDGGTLIGANLPDYLRLVVSGGDETVQVDTDGTAGGATWSDVAILTGGASGAALFKIGPLTYIAGGSGNDTVTGSPTVGGLFDLSAGGNDTATGGSGNDGFQFGAAYTSADHVDGGAGTNDQIALQGDYSAGVILSGSSIVNVEAMALLPGFNYNLTTTDTLVPSGKTFTFWSVSMASANHVSIDGSAETDGLFHFYLGQGDDTAIGGAGADIFYAEGGADTLTGNGGADTFAYLAVSDSTGPAYDTITDFTAGTDKFDLPVAVAAVDATVATGALSTVSFDTDLATAVGASQLAVGHAVLFTPDTGSLATHTFLVVDANGTAGYQAGADFVFDVTGGSLGGLGTGDFF